MTITDWQINIENLAESVAEKYGSEEAEFIFSKYGATCFDDLSPAHYGDVFDELDLRDADG